MKIGIACTTLSHTPRRLEQWLRQVKKHAPKTEHVIYVAEDSRELRKGISVQKNECLRNLYDAGCTDFFLFDDDCFPIKDGWAECFIETSQASGQKHFMYLHETPSIKKIESSEPNAFLIAKGPECLKHGEFNIEGNARFVQANIYNNSAGCLLYLTRNVVEKVGGFSTRFHRYGFEHANYSDRIHMAGFTPLGKYSCPAGAEQYIYSCDLDNHIPEFNRFIEQESSLTPAEKIACVQANRAVYEQDTKLYYPLFEM